jgi:DNA mismatch repair ATPase MutS
MATFTETQSIILILIIAAVVIGVLILLPYRSKKKAERHIRDAFGKTPSCEKEDLDYLTYYHVYASHEKSDEVLIDDITWNDLNMDDIFQRVNVCSCSIGEEYLYHVLHELKTNLPDLEKREQLLKWIKEHPEERVGLQKILLSIGRRKSNGLSFFLFHALSKKLKHAWIYIIMALLPFAGIVLMPFFAKAGFLFILCAVCLNVYVYSRKRLMLEGELETMQYFSALLYGAKSINHRLGSQMKSLGFDLMAAIKPFRRIGGLIPGSAQKITSDLESFMILLKAVFLIDLILFNRTVNHLIRYNDELNQLYRIVGELDAGISIASYRQGLELYCVPEFHDDNTICFSEAYHPLLKYPITNSGYIGNDSIVTGSNASGKSTFIKTIAINNILAQTINTCCAKKYKLSFSYVASSMAIKDDIRSGDSYFITEIKSLKRIMQYCKDQRCVCFVDEILRGTNTPERIAASTAVLKSLHETDSLCLVASHDIELTKILAGIYDNYHFSEKFENDIIEFDYLLKKGASHSTNAIRLLKHMGFDQRIVEEALAIIQTNADEIVKEQRQ